MNLGRTGWALAAALLLLLGTAGLAAAAAPAGGREAKKPKLDVGYQPTPNDIVDRMLEIAAVGPQDRVYDLGCGDGRLVVRAAKHRGARGVGVDLDPQRIRESRENARRAGVTDHVRFLEQDLFRTGIGEATVVMLYLWPEVNLRLRPKLFAELKPGTRVLSHSHDMGDWRPDHYEEVRKHHLHFWVMPAELAGDWSGPLRIGGRTYGATLRLAQTFQEVSGSLTIGEATAPVAPTRLRGDRLSLAAEIVLEGQRLPLTLEAQAAGPTLQGTLAIAGAAPEKGPWRAERAPSRSGR